MDPMGYKQPKRFGALSNCDNYFNFVMFGYQDYIVQVSWMCLFLDFLYHGKSPLNHPKTMNNDGFKP